MGQVQGDLYEMFVAPNDWSAAGKQRIENQLARDHATAERIASEAFNREEAEKAREWQERLANTSYQRAVADLQAAGINPILAAGTPGAATPVGASARSAAAPAAGNYTKSTGLDTLVRLTSLVLMGVNTGARLAAVSGQTLAKTAAKSAASAAANTSATLSGKAPHWIDKYIAEMDARDAARAAESEAWAKKSYNEILKEFKKNHPDA